MKNKIGIIGFGNMGSAIAAQLKTDYQIFVFDKDPAKLSGLSGIKVVKDLSLLAGSAAILIIAVKPQDFDEVLGVIKDDCRGKLVISIAAGITTQYLEKVLGVARVIRVMPNLPAKINAGMSCLCKGRFSSEEDLDLAEGLFDYVGETVRLEEKLMDAATAVSGSGPAYVCWFLETGSLDAGKISDKEKQAFLKNFSFAAQGVGFTQREAEFLVKATFSGTVKFLRNYKITPAELRKQVTSKGGTTEAALEILQKGGTLPEAVKAARDRALALAKK